MKSKVVTGSRGKFVLRWQDQRSGRWRERSTNLDAVERNRGKAYQMLADLRAELSGEAPPSLTIPPNRARVVEPESGAFGSLDGNWDDYLEYFTQNHLNGLSIHYRKSILPIVGVFQRFSNIKYLQEITPQVLRLWVSNLQDKQLALPSIHSYLRNLSAFLRVAVDDGIIRSVPKIRLPKLDRGKQAKGRSLTGEEFDRILSAAVKYRPKYATDWKFALQGLWFGGLRIGEAYRLTWDESDFSVDLDRKYPCFLILAAGQKSRTSQTVPMAPDFADLLRTVPAKQRRGKVFRFVSERGETLTQTRVQDVIRELGEKAKVVVSNKRLKGEPKTKTATAHDFRRSFGTRWAMRVMPQVLQQMMRHSDLETTMRFYVDIRSDDLGEAIYGSMPQENTASKKGRPTKTRRKPT